MYERPCLHEAAQSEGGIIESRLLQVLLCCMLYPHERHIIMLVTIVNAEKDV